MILHATYRSLLMTILIEACAAITAPSQDRLPSSFNDTPGVHIAAYDGLPHRSEAYYSALCAVVDAEMRVEHAAPSLQVVFVDQATADKIIAANPGRFQGKDFTGAFIPPSLILIVGDEESDDTFMHEYLHYLQTAGLVFRGVPLGQVHRCIDVTEGYLLGSRSYISLIQTRLP